MQKKQPTILTIEDSINIRRFLKTSITNQHYHFIECGCGSEGLALATIHQPDIILLDLGLPDVDGLVVIKELRAWCSTPIIVLSARDQENDKVVALDLGADDYLTKPFSVSELNARLRVALRHGERIQETEKPVFESKNLKIDFVKREVYVTGLKMTLTPTQYAILAILARKANKIVTHKQILKEVWGETHTNDLDYLRIYIHQLRQKLEPNPSCPQFFKTEPGIGYRLISH